MRSVASLGCALLSITVPLSMMACGGGGASSSGGGGATTSSSGGQQATWQCGDPEPLEPVSTDWCARIPVGTKGARTVPVDLSAAHALVRFFGPVTTYKEADQALAAALDGDAAWSGKDLSSYTAMLAGVACSGPAADLPALGPVTIAQLDSGVALVKPGTGPVTLPEGTTAVMVDLRNLPWIEGIREAILAAVSPALKEPLAGPTRRVRHHDGMTDEAGSAQNVYDNSLAKVAAEDFPASGAVDLPLAVVTSARMPPEAVEIAAALRLAGRARIVGEGLRIEVAESRWIGVGSVGVAAREEDLFSGSTRYPDSIEPDVRTAHPECHAALVKEPVPAVVTGKDERPAMKRMKPFGDEQPAIESRGAARAALLIAHGATRLFYPYFPVVGDHIDARLDEALQAVPEAPTREEMRGSLRRFGEALSDGHVNVLDLSNLKTAQLPLYVEHVNGTPVVRRSAVNEIAPGDVITSINGVPAAEYYEKEAERTSAATEGCREYKISREYRFTNEPVELGLLGVDSSSKSVLVSPVADNPVRAPSGRSAGFLADLGQPEVYYVNLDVDDIAVVKTGLAEAEAQGAKGLVLDMRGYPRFSHYELAQRLVTTDFWSPYFELPVWDGPEKFTTEESRFSRPPLSSPSFHGKLALLVGHQTISAAENFSMMLVDAGRVTVFGRRSAGTNGNITGLQLPGHFAFIYTGMGVLHADKSVFHGVGVAPEVETPLSAQDFADGVDPELEEAAAFLGAQ